MTSPVPTDSVPELGSGNTTGSVEHPASPAARAVDNVGHSQPAERRAGL